LFPKATDEHKPNKPQVPNGLGILYVLFSTIYLFGVHYDFFRLREPNITVALRPLALAGCILFGGFLGLVDDWMNLKWRYKAIIPVFAAVPLATLYQGDASMSTYIFGKINFGIYFYIIMIPLIVTVVTNVVNQLGGLNGLETVCPSIVMIGLFIVSPLRPLLYVPLATYLVLAFFNFRGKIFVGNTGTFAIGITLASFAIIANREQTLLISILPYIFNSSLILVNSLFFKRRASLILEGNKLRADSRRSLLTLIAYYKPLTERKLVAIVALIMAASTSIAVLMSVLMWMMS
jgi:UDP-N-acetylglucosamine--dolichyl-phosphate N-acetylglucosaminephosphotransferase